MWSAGLDPHVLAVSAEPVGAVHPDAFDLARLGRWATLAHGADGREYLALSDGWRRIRIDVVDGTLGSGPVRLQYRMSGFTRLEPRLLAARRLLSLWQRRRFLRALFPPVTGLARRLEALRTADALADGASYREIAVALFGKARVQAEWRTDSDFLLMRVRRRVAEARRMAEGGWRDLLGS